jgi:hypothetical protein
MHPDFMCVHLDFMQHAEKAPINAVIPPTEDAIQRITNLVNSAGIVLFINNILIRKLLYENKGDGT